MLLILWLVISCEGINEPELIGVIPLEYKNKEIISKSVNGDVALVWRCFTEPKDIVKWFFVSQNFYCSFAFNSLTTGENFTYRMDPKKEGQGFDIEGTFEKVVPLKELSFHSKDSYTQMKFIEKDSQVEINITIKYDKENSPMDMKYVWECLLDNFSQYIENIKN